MIRTEQRAGESIVDSWTVNASIPETDRRWLGKLWVTSQRAVFEPLYDNTDFASAVYGANASSDSFSIEYAEVAQVSARKSFFKKIVVIELQSGSSWLFDYGMLSVDKLLDALNMQIQQFDGAD